MRVVCAVLASGLSRRLGRPKQLVDFHGKPLIRHAVETAIASGCDETIVVVPPGQFREALGALAVRLIDNPDAAEGVSASIRLAARSSRDARILFTLCDQPRVTSAHLRALIAADAPIVATGYAGIAGVPAVFAPQFKSELLALRGDRGARSVIDAHRGDVVVIPFEDAAMDVDVEGDTVRL